jgi:hypothetical protein
MASRPPTTMSHSSILPAPVDASCPDEAFAVVPEDPLDDVPPVALVAPPAVVELVVEPATVVVVDDVVVETGAVVVVVEVVDVVLLVVVLLVVVLLVVLLVGDEVPTAGPAGTKRNKTIAAAATRGTTKRIGLRLRPRGCSMDPSGPGFENCWRIVEERVVHRPV